jgi:hypothetical protein
MRSIVAGEIWSRAWKTSGARGPKDGLFPGIQRGKIAFNRFEQGRFAVSQIFLRGLRIWGWE